LICPSDQENRLRDMDQPTCVALSEQFTCTGGRQGDCGQECGGVDLAGDSYGYLGWVFDKLAVNQTLSQNVQGESLTICQITGDTTDCGVSAPTQTTQVFEIFLNEVVLCLALQPTQTTQQDCTNEAPDKDFDGIIDPNNPTEPYGVGESDTVFRLREGIERALITDINNPGASSRAQSAIFVLWDLTSRTAADFNHVPGGSNVLYLDGHVDFIRYPGPEDSPLNRGFAQYLAEIQLN
jgi:prepilin-type processing-associated H-X9-DG protein